MKNATVIEILKPLVDDEDILIYDLPDLVVNWPDVEVEDSGETDLEPLDLENWEILSLDESSMVMCAGGDWQEPLKMTLVPTEDGKLKVIDIVHDFYDASGIEWEKLIEILSK